MAHVEASIVVERPVQTVYNQWTQFESFPEFMQGVEKVVQTDDTHLHWQATIAGASREWDAEIVEQVPDQRVAWRSVGGEANGGIVTFRPLAADRTEVHARIEYEPEGLAEKAADAAGVVQRRTAGDLERFKEFIEGRAAETGAWRGRVQ